MQQEWILKLEDNLGACRKAIDWCRTKPSAAEAWRTCPRGDWLLWIAVRLGTDRRAIVAAACECARLALRFVPDGELRPAVAIETAERWTRGEATLAEVRHAADAAYDAAAATYAAAANAAYAAADAAYAAAHADSADSAANSAVAAYTEDARAKTLRRCATIVRRHINRPEI